MSDESTLRLAVEALQLEYVHAIDDGEIERWPEFFTDPCLYQLTGRDNYQRNLPVAVMRCESRAMLRDRVTAIRNASVFASRYIRHVLGGTRIIGRADDEILAQTNLAVYQTNTDGESMLLMAAEYRDRILEQDGGLKFREKLVIYDTLRLADSVVYPI